MSVDWIFGVFCFLVVLNIGTMKGSYTYIAFCNKRYDHPTAHHTCIEKDGNGTLLTLATFNLHKEWITKKIKEMQHKNHKYWTQKTQGLLNKNASSACNTQVDKCPYIEKKNGKFLCNESSCDGKFFFLCEKDSTFNHKDCFLISRLSKHTSTQSNIEEHTTAFYSNNVTNRMTPTQSSKIEGNSPLMFPVLICLILSLLLLLSTIPAVMKRRMVRRKRKQSVMHGNNYHEISLDYLQEKSVDDTSSKSMTYSTISGLKETVPVNPTNVYSSFSVQSSVYNKLKRSRKRSRKNENIDNSIYSSLNANKRTDQNSKETDLNDSANGMNDGIACLENQKEDISCNGIISRQNGEYCLAKVISMNSEDSENVLKETVFRNTMRKTSSMPSAIAPSAEDHNVVRCAPIHNNMRSQSCEIFDYEMARFAPIVDNRSHSIEKCFTENADYDMAIFVPINEDKKKQLRDSFSTENVDYEINREVNAIRQLSEAKSSDDSAYEMIRKTSMCSYEVPACEIIQNIENLQTLIVDTKEDTKSQDPF